MTSLNVEDGAPQKRPVFALLCGLPGAGKSTIRAKVLRDWTNPHYVYSTDDIVVQRGMLLNQTYNEAFEHSIKAATRVANVNVHAAFLRGDDVLWDQTNLSAKKRKAVLQQVPKHYEKICIVVSVDEAERQRRLSQREGKTIPPAVDASMVKSWEPPTPDEGWALIVHARQ